MGWTRLLRKRGRLAIGGGDAPRVRRTERGDSSGASATSRCLSAAALYKLASHSSGVGIPRLFNFMPPGEVRESGESVLGP